MPLPKQVACFWTRCLLHRLFCSKCFQFRLISNFNLYFPQTLFCFMCNVIIRRGCNAVRVLASGGTWAKHLQRESQSYWAPIRPCLLLPLTAFTVEVLVSIPCALMRWCWRQVLWMDGQRISKANLFTKLEASVHIWNSTESAVLFPSQDPYVVRFLSLFCLITIFLSFTVLTVSHGVFQLIPLRSCTQFSSVCMSKWAITRELDSLC